MQKVAEKLTKIIPRFLPSMALLSLTLFWIYSKAEYVYCERLWPDEALYAWYGLKIVHNPAFLFSREIVQFHPPLFSLWLALGQMFSPSLAACQTLSFLCSIGGIWGIYYLGSQGYSRFVGLLAALSLAGNPIYAQYSTKILIDTPQMLLFTLLALALFRATESDRRKVDVCVGLLGAAIVWLKWSGAVVVFLIALVYGLLIPLRNSKGILKSNKRAPEASGLRRTVSPGINALKRLCIPLSILASALLLFWLQTGGLFHYGVSLRSHHSEQPFWFYIIYLPEIMGTLWLIPFLIVGIIGALRKREWISFVLLLWVLVVFAAMTAVAEKTLRFGMLFLPPILILAASGIERVLRFLARNPKNFLAGQVLAIGLLAFFLVVATGKISFDLREENKFYKGFTEVGSWIRANAPKGSVIVSTSPRNVQYAARLNLRDNSVALINFPKQKDALESLLDKEKGLVILQIDNWGDPGVLRFNPLSKDDLIYYEKLGFSLKKTGGQLKYRKAKNVFVIGPAIWVLERQGLLR